MAHTFFGCGQQADFAPCVGGQMPDIVALIGDHRRCRFHFAGQRQDQFILPVARYAADTQHFAFAHCDADFAQWCAKPVRCRRAEPAKFQYSLAHRTRRFFRDMQHCADHKFRHITGGRRTRIAGANHLTQSQHCGIVTKRANFLELVRDIQDRSAFSAKLAQSLEQDRDLLRGQHRCRLVHDQKLRILQ